MNSSADHSSESGLEQFLSYCMTTPLAGRALIIEPSSSHQEVIPSLIYHFRQHGIGVDVIVASDTIKTREIFPALPDAIQNDTHFFYAIDNHNLAVLAQIFNSYRYGFYFFNTLFYKLEWAVLSNAVKGHGKMFAIAHNGLEMNDNIFSFFGLCKEQVFVLSTAFSRKYEQPFIIPSLFYQEASSASITSPQRVRLAVVGNFEHTRRDYNSLMDAAIQMNEYGLGDRYEMMLIGDAPQHEKENFQHYKENIKRYSLSHNITLCHSLPFAEMFSILKESHLLMLLLNAKSRSMSSYLHDQIPGCMNLAYGFHLVPVLEKEFADAWQAGAFCLEYDADAGNSMALAIKELLENPPLFDRLKASLQEKNKHLVEESANNFKARVLA